MPDLTYEGRRQLYADLWASMEIRPLKAADIDATARKVLAYKTGRYKAVQEATGVPWFVVGTIHQLECGGNFATHLHNGDPLRARTVQVPRGRPVDGVPPFSWKESACDAVHYDGLDKVKEWPIERVLFELERYNGFGYAKFHADVNTPYLWSGSNHYARGKYVADGKWSSAAVSGQSGAAPILKRLVELDPEVAAALAGTVAANPVEEVVDDPAAAFPKAHGQRASVVGTAYGSRTIWAQLMTIVSIVLGVITDWAKQGWDFLMWLIGIAPDVYGDAKESLTNAQEMAGWFGANWTKISVSVALLCISVAIVRHLNDKRKLAESN